MIWLFTIPILIVTRTKQMQLQMFCLGGLWEKSFERCVSEPHSNVSEPCSHVLSFKFSSLGLTFQASYFWALLSRCQLRVSEPHFHVSKPRFHVLSLAFLSLMFLSLASTSPSFALTFTSPNLWVLLFQALSCRFSAFLWTWSRFTRFLFAEH